MKNYLLFDLDGTLSDPKTGICTCVQYALASFGIEEPDLDKLEPFIGPPLKDSFMQFYNMSEEQAAEAVAKYRERFAEVGLFENTIYPGIPAMLRALSGHGMYLAVASSKPTVFVERILEHFGIRKYFKAVVGSELDGTRSKKDEVVNEALRQLFGEQLVDKSKVYMIGDRKFDVEGAHAMGIESVGVTYGYGGMEELRAAKSDYIVRTVDELQRFLLRETESEKKSGIDIHRLWRVAYPFAMFLLIRLFVSSMLQLMYSMSGGDFFGIKLLTLAPDGSPESMTGAGYGFASIVGFLAAAFFLKKGTGVMVKRAKEESKLFHLRGYALEDYVAYGAATVFLAVGLNLFFSLTGAVAHSASYQETSDLQYSVPVVLALILYGFAAPLAEEMLFRGVIFNSFHRSVKALPAALLASLLFGIYHGNSIQALYAFAMGMMLNYGYYYFGDFRVCLALHAVVNLFSYALSSNRLQGTPLISWPVCIGCLVLFAGGYYFLRRKKKAFI